MLGRFVHDVAGRGEAAAGRRCAARRHRAAAGRAARRVDSRDRDSAGAARGVRPGGPRRRHRGRRSRVGRRRAARRTRRPRSRCTLPIIWRGCCRRNDDRTTVRSKADPGPARPATYVRSGLSRTMTRPTRAKRKSSTTCGRTARRSSVRCTTRSAAAIPAETVDALWNLAWQGLVTNDTFHALRAFTRAPRATVEELARSSAARRPRGAFRSRRLAPALRRRTMGAGAGRAAHDRRHQMGCRDRAAAARAPRRPHPRRGRRRVGPRRFRQRLPGAEGDGGKRPRAARLFRRRPRGHAVRASRCARSAAIAARRGGNDDAGRGRPCGDRSGEPVRRHVEMAVTTINAEPAEHAERSWLCGFCGFRVERRGFDRGEAAGARRERWARR